MISDITKEVEKLADEYGIDKKRSIGEVAQEIGVEPHVIRFWEEQFSQIKPEIGKGGRRYYYNKQLKVLKRIKRFLHDEGYTIAGLQKLLKKRKQDSYKEEDLDIIVISGDNKKLIDYDIGDFVIDEERDEMVVNADFAGFNHEVSANLVANISQLANISKASEHHLSKEQRDEISSLFKNITRNLGDLKMLLRS